MRSILYNFRNEISVLDLFGEQSVVLHKYDICAYFIIFVWRSLRSLCGYHTIVYHNTSHHTIPYQHHTTKYHPSSPHTYPVTRAPQLSVDRPIHNFRSSRREPIQAKCDFRQMVTPHHTTPGPYHTTTNPTMPDKSWLTA